MKVGPISYADVAASPELLLEYAAECSLPGIGPICPMWEMYAALEASGCYQVFGTHEDGNLIGFACVLTTMNPHYSRMVATVESLFVRRDYRNGTLAARLMRAMEVHAEARGCVAILYSALAGSVLEKLLEKRIERSNAVFSKALAVRT